MINYAFCHFSNENKNNYFFINTAAQAQVPMPNDLTFQSKLFMAGCDYNENEK